MDQISKKKKMQKKTKILLFLLINWVIVLAATDSSEETIVSDFCSICFNKFYSGSKECDQVLDKLCDIHQFKLIMNHNMTECQPKPKLDYTDNGDECTLKCGTEGKVSTYPRS
jgi:hypothetical protein